MNPILKAHLEGVEMFDKDYPALGACSKVKKQRVWHRNHWLLFGNLCNHDDYIFCESRRKYLKRFLTTYGINLLKAAREAGPEENPVMVMQDGVSYDHYGVAGHNNCLSIFHQAIDEGIKEITNNS